MILKTVRTRNNPKYESEVFLIDNMIECTIF